VVGVDAAAVSADADAGAFASVFESIVAGAAVVATAVSEVAVPKEAAFDVGVLAAANSEATAPEAFMLESEMVDAATGACVEAA
jgi:hypothetical protein